MTLGISLAVTGLAVTGGYWLLRYQHIGKISEATDIGGGFLAPTGFGMVLAGLIVLVAALVQGRRRQDR